MNQTTLLELYLKKDPRAIEESLAAHGYIMRRVAMNLLAGEAEAETAVTEVLERAWESIPPARPAHMDAYLLKLTRLVSIDRYMNGHEVKRGYNLFATVLDELGECRPARSGMSLGGFDREAEALRAGECLSRFLKKLGGEGRDIFLCRYFYADSLSEIARRVGLNENRVKSRLTSLRRKLKRFLEKEESMAWEADPETLARGLSHVDDTFVLAAHKGVKKARRLIPWGVAACLIAALAVSFPYLREVINTDLVLRGPDWNKPKDEIGDAEIAHKPKPEEIKGMGIPVTVGNSTLTLTDVTETTVTLTLVKTDDTPLYAAVYDRMGDALACTDPDYKVDGVTIRAGRIKVYADGASEPETELPTAPGTYTLVVDFTSVRNGSYPMEAYMGFFAYIGKDGAPVTVYLSLEIPEEETTAGESAEGESESDTEAPTEGE